MKTALKRQPAGSVLKLLAVLCLSVFTPPPTRAQSAEPIREVWWRPLGSVQCLAIAPDGARVAVVTWASEVLCWEGSRERWRRTLPGAQAVVLGAGGRAVVYTPLDAQRRDLLLLNALGRPQGRITADGPISALSLSPDGRYAAVGTVGGSVELHDLKSRTRPHLLRVPGICQQLSHDRQGNLVVTTADPAVLLLFRADGRPLWQLPAPPGAEYRIGTPTRTTGDRTTGAITLAAVVASGVRRPEQVTAGEPGPDGRTDGSPTGSVVTVRGRAWTAPGRNEIHLIGIGPSGKPIWRRTLKGRNPSLCVMHASGDAVLGYERADRRKSVVRYHRVIACFGADGSDRWEQGGMVYDPLLVTASPGGETVLSLCGGNRFWLLTGRGQQLWTYSTVARVRMARASASGSSVAVTTSNGQLLLLAIHPSARESGHRKTDLARREMGAER
jgi:hypothetical protein